MKNLKVLNMQNVSSQCVVCGVHNAFSLKSKFFELEGKIVVGVFTPRDEHQSYPERMHGGMISAVLDEVIGRAVQIGAPDVWGVTAELKTRFLKPVQLNKELKCFAKLYQENSRIFKGVAVLEDSNGELLATGEATYFKMDINKISSHMDENDWFGENLKQPEQIMIYNDQAFEKLLNKN